MLWQNGNHAKEITQYTAALCGKGHITANVSSLILLYKCHHVVCLSYTSGYGLQIR